MLIVSFLILGYGKQNSSKISGTVAGSDSPHYVDGSHSRFAIVEKFDQHIARVQGLNLYIFVHLDRKKLRYPDICVLLSGSVGLIIHQLFGKDKRNK